MIVFEILNHMFRFVGNYLVYLNGSETPEKNTTCTYHYDMYPLKSDIDALHNSYILILFIVISFFLGFGNLI